MDWTEAVTEHDEVYDQWAKARYHVAGWEMLTPGQVLEMISDIRAFEQDNAR